MIIIITSWPVIYNFVTYTKSEYEFLLATYLSTVYFSNILYSNTFYNKLYVISAINWNPHKTTHSTCSNSRYKF